MNRLLSILSICRKAGKLQMGFDPVEASLGKGAALVLFSSDVSPKTRERMEQKAGRFGVPVMGLSCTSDEIWQAVGKKLAVMAVTDKGLAGKAASLAKDDYKEESDI